MARLVLSLVFCCTAVWILTGTAAADVTDLSHGVFICHEPPGLQYSPGLDWCGEYANYAITSCEEQNPRTDSNNPLEPTVWYVIAAFEEDKEWCGLGFGFNDFTTATFYFTAHGQCPTDAIILNTNGWPGPGEGMSLAAAGTSWSGNFQPVYWFEGYAYYEGQIQLVPEPQQDFLGFGNCEIPAEAFDAACAPAMGCLTDGIECCPTSGGDPEAVCCVLGECSILTEVDCAAAGGTWYQELDSCDPNPCPAEWACCIADLCTVRTEDDCENNFGTWHPGFYCPTTGIDPAYDCSSQGELTPCCLPSNECVMTYPQDCLEYWGGQVYYAYESCDPNPCIPQTFIVRPDGTGDFPTIQTAISAAESGDTILLGAGIFTGTGNRDLNCQGKSLQIVSEANHPDSCTIDCQGTAIDPHRAFHLRFAETADCVIEAVTIVNGHAGSEPGDLGGAIFASGASPTIRRCIIRDCVAYDGAAMGCENASPEIERCSIVLNSAAAPGTGGALHCDALSAPQLQQTIVALSSQGMAVSCEAGAAPTLSCCDLWENEGGDWVDCIAEQYGMEGNVSLDPAFCALEEDNFTVACDSPCLLNSCGSMGALGEGCSFYAITALEDVAGDQGGQIRLRWHRACDDSFYGVPPIAFYSIWRRIDRHGQQERRQPSVEGNNARWPDLRTSAVATPRRDYPPGDWDYVTLVPASGETTYSTLVPTLCDSTSQGICWSVFFLRAHTDIPTYYFDTVPDSGYSVDNLAPSPPEDLRLEQGTTLVWDPPSVEDFDYCSIYGSSHDELDSTGVVLGHTSGTTFTLSPPYWDFYHVTMTDFAGNEGEEASVSGFARAPLPTVPKKTAFLPGRPSPASRGDAILLTFQVPTTQRVQIDAFDVVGRLVKTLYDGVAAPGAHSVTWDLLDSDGRLLPSGVYLCRMSTEGFGETRKITLR